LPGSGPVGVPLSRRVRLDLAYDGTDFSGWAVQPGRRTVQGDLERSLGVLLRLDPPPRVTVAGRTDAGVHATGQVAHVDLPAGVAEPPTVRGLNGLLARDVRVRAARWAPPGFDARFSPLWRAYRYQLVDGTPNPLRRREVVAWPRRLDTAAMHAAGQLLLGLGDFAAFCRRREGATTVRTLLELAVHREAGGDIRVDVRADAFCHSMVRSLVGALVAVGEGHRPVDWPATLLHSSGRSSDIRVAAPHGLTLVTVAYPPDEELAARAAETRAVRTLPGTAPL
jgi:tRNA pseudouridine38-40 synthase